MPRLLNTTMPRLDACARKRRLWIALPVALLAVPVVLRALGIEPTNRATTSPGSADASLRTRFYDAPPFKVRAQILEAVPTLATYGRSWRLQSQSATEIRCEVPVLIFTDDLTVTVTPHGDGSRLEVASASRVGKGDFGENARHIRQLLGELDKRLR